MNFQSLTEKQRSIFDFISESLQATKIAPSLREIAKHFRVSVGTAQDQVAALIKKGFLEKDPLLSRALRLPAQASQIPILGRVHAGPLHEAIENVEGYIPAEGSKFFPNLFALRVRGDSMINAGILEGDIVIVQWQELARTGDIVVARVEDEASIKYLREDSDGLFLEPANPAYSAIRNVPFSIAGVVVEVRRQLKRWK